MILVQHHIFVRKLYCPLLPDTCGTLLKHMLRLTKLRMLDLTMFIVRFHLTVIILKIELLSLGEDLNRSNFHHIFLGTMCNKMCLSVVTNCNHIPISFHK